MLVCGDCGGEVVYLTKPKAYRCEKCKRQESGTYEQRGAIWQDAIGADREEEVMLDWCRLDSSLGAKKRK